jgi:heme/copper-type cytochrome/quinol oxidase subunit 4
VKATDRDWAVRCVLTAVLVVAFVVLGVFWWTSEDYLNATLQFALGAGFLILALDDLVWNDTRRPTWASAILGAVVAYFLTTVALLLTR